MSNTRYTIQAGAERTPVSYYSGRTMVIRGFFVVSPAGRKVRAFAQGTAQKWTPALEQSLREKAAAWAEELNRRAGL